MDCDDIKPMLAGYADGQLSPLETVTVEQHIDACGRCRQVIHDQQRIQHVLKSFAPPPVEPDQWNAIAKALRRELEGKEEPVVLKTRPRVDTLDPTPAELSSLRRPEEAPARTPEPAAPPPAEVRTPAEPRTPSPVRIVQRRPPSISALRVSRAKKRRPSAWGAHFAGALAAGLVIALGILSALHQTSPGLQAQPIDLQALARQGDVEVHSIETTASNYDVIFYGGDPNTVAAVFVTYDNG